MTYDKADRLTQVAYDSMTVDVRYFDGGGQPRSVTTPNEEIDYGWDGSLLKSETWSGTIGATVSRAYNSDLLTSSLDLNGSQVVKYSYDPDLLLQQANDLSLSYDPGNGELDSLAVQNLTDSLTYSAYGEVASSTWSGPNGTIFKQSYTRDALGRVTGIKETDPDGGTHTTGYLFDPAGRLTGVTLDGKTTASYAYDANGNRLTRTLADGGALQGVYDDRDRLLSYGDLAYAYTPDGELQSKTDTSTGEVTSYAYDAMGNLLSVSQPDGGTVEYVVDGLNRRIATKVNGQQTQGFVYQSQLQPIAMLDASGAVVQKYVYATHDNVPDLIIDSSGKQYQVVTNHLGSVVAVVNVSTGAIEQRDRLRRMGQHHP